MSEELANIERRTGTEAQLKTAGQVVEGGAAFPNDVPKILHRRRANAPSKPGEIIEFVQSADKVVGTAQEMADAFSDSSVETIFVRRFFNLSGVGLVNSNGSQKIIFGAPFAVGLTRILAQANQKIFFYNEVDLTNVGGSQAWTLEGGANLEVYLRRIKTTSGARLLFTEVSGTGFLRYENNDAVSLAGQTTKISRELWDNTANESGGSGLPIDGSSGFDILSSEPAYGQAKLYYLAKARTIVLMNDKADVRLELGRESWVRAKNETGNTIPNGSPVYISGGTDESGQPVATIALAQANSKTTCSNVVITTEEIADGAFGECARFGFVKSLNTDSFSVGDILYISPSSPGGYTLTEPTFPNLSAKVGRVIKKDPLQGSIFVDPDTDPQFSTGGTSSFPPVLTLSALGNIQNTAAQLKKADAASIKPTFNWNGTGSPSSTMWDNGDCDPFVSNGGTIRGVTINCAGCAVSQGTKGATVYSRLEVWEIKTQSEGGPVKLANLLVVMEPNSEIGVNNNLGTTPGVRGVASTALVIPAGTLVGFILRHSDGFSGGNQYINAWRNTVVSLNWY